ncbi:hypothetical protein B0H14DRAFT_2715626, partial [Mycena olivaceomarginata]
LRAEPSPGTTDVDRNRPPAARSDLNGASRHNENHTPQSSEEHTPPLKLLKLLFVVAVASTSGKYRCILDMNIQDERRPSDPSKLISHIPGSTWASAVVCFASIGWWKALGRKPVLFISLLGTVLLDLILVAVARTSFRNDGVSIGLIVEGLLGGFPTFIGVVHAYASDVSPSPISRTIIFGGIQAILFVSFRVGAYLGSFAGLIFTGNVHDTLGYALSIPLAFANLAYVYYNLPESLTLQRTENLPHPQSTSLNYIFAPFTTLARKGPSRGKVVLLGFSIFVYSWTSAFAVKMVIFTSKQGFFHALPRWLLLIIPAAINIGTLLAVFPALASLVKSTYGDSEKSGRLLARSLAQNSILVAAVCSIGILVFGGPRSSLLYGIFFFVYPFSIGALPALYSLGASYFIALGRSAELGTLFGALSIWYGYPNDNAYTLYYLVEWTAFYLVVSLLLLVPNGPPAESTDATADRNEEGGAV